MFAHESRGCLDQPARGARQERRGGRGHAGRAAREPRRAGHRGPPVARGGRLALDAVEGGHLVIGAMSAAHGDGGDRPADRPVAAGTARSRCSSRWPKACAAWWRRCCCTSRAAGASRPASCCSTRRAIANLIAEGRLSQLPLALDSGRKHGMVPLNDALAAFVQSGVVDVREAYRQGVRAAGLPGRAAPRGLDTSFVERLA